MSTPAAAKRETPKRSHSRKKPPAVAASNAIQQGQQGANAQQLEKKQLNQLNFIIENTQEWFSMLGCSIQNAATQEQQQRYITLANNFSRLFAPELPMQHNNRSMAQRA